MQLSVQLLAGPLIFNNDVELSNTTNRSSLFFAYLAYQADWVSRETLLTLFWPEKREAQARKNLRTLLYKSKKEAFAEHLEIEETRVRWLVTTDINSFQEAIAQANWMTAVELYKGAFLENYNANESTEFENWLEQTRNDLHASWREATLQVSEVFIAQEKYKDLISLAQKVLHYDDLAEELVAVCMKSQALAGQKAQALKTYESFRQKLIHELDIEPLDSTQALADSIREGQFQKSKQPAIEKQSVVGSQKSQSLGVLPQHLTPFIGRKLELLDLADLLEESQYRQITLLGPGGIGKSRLAVELLKAQASAFRDGVVFTSLVALTSATDIPDSLAAALGITLLGNSSVENEVIAYLEDKEMLIVFDSFEHVLEGTKLLTEILSRTKGIKILCTSRVLLSMPNELVYDVVGLTTPELGEHNLEAYDATRLFISSTRRTKLDFKVETEDYAPLVELCQILDGMPLAIELASTWIRLLSISELLKELSTDNDFLEVEGQQLADRHKSMRSVFETSWQLLTNEEQHVLAELSIFRGGFDRQAVRKIVNTSVRTLLSLVNKSLIKTDTKGRFVIHELIRQYAKEKLTHDIATLESKHGNYYLNLLKDLLNTLKSASPKESLDQIKLDLENIRLAWQWALSSKAFSLCEQAVEPLSVFFVSKYRLQEGLSFWLQALNNKEVQAEAKLSCLIRLELGNFYRGLDQYDSAQKHLQLGIEAAKLLQYDRESLLVMGLTTLANIKARLGVFEEALLFAQEAHTFASNQAKQDLILKARVQLAYCLECAGSISEAEQHYAFVLTEERRKNYPVSLLPALGASGLFLIEIGEAEKAQALFREGLVLVETYDISMQRSFMWEGLGRASFLLGKYEDALQQSQKALAYSEKMQDIMGIAVESHDVAKCLLALGDLSKAKVYLEKSLAIIWKAGELPWVMQLLFVWAQYFLQINEQSRAHHLFQLVSSHESTKFLTKEKAKAEFERLASHADMIEQASLESLVNDLLSATALM